MDDCPLKLVDKQIITHKKTGQEILVFIIRVNRFRIISYSGVIGDFSLLNEADTLIQKGLKSNVKEITEMVI